MFGSLNNTKKMNTHGIGLGLFICKNIVTHFGGTIQVESKLGVGSKFQFSLDLEDERP